MDKALAVRKSCGAPAPDRRALVVKLRAEFESAVTAATFLTVLV